jgi:HK97 family phage portal protein
MGILSDALTPSRAVASGGAWPATDERWYVKDLSGYMIESGGPIALNAETIFRCGRVLAAVAFRGDSFAVCAPEEFQQVGRRKVAVPDGPVQRLLERPNLWQTGNRWRNLMGVWLATWGNAYCEIKPGRDYFAGELWPIHPSNVPPDQIKQRSDGGLLYQVLREGGKPDSIGYERMLHFRDIGTDGITGLEIYRLIRNACAIALLAQRHGTTFLQKGTRISGLIVPNKPLGREGRAELKKALNEDLGGSQGVGTLGILPSGVDLKPLSLSTKESAVLELSDSTVGEMLAFLRVPAFAVGYQGDKAATAAWSKETTEQSLRHCVAPIFSNIEAEEGKSLLLEGSGRSIKHNLNDLYRANLKDRYAANFQACGGPWMTVNEVRESEEWDPDPDQRHDKILTPGNMSPELNADGGTDDGEDEDDEQAPPKRAPEEKRGRPSQASGRLRDIAMRFAEDNASRVVRRELEAVVSKAKKYSRDPAGWRAFVAAFYSDHASYVSKTMRVSDGRAREYCDGQAAALASAGAAAAEKWEAEVPPRLAALALEA